MTLSLGLLPTTVVGSHPQPDWLIDRDRLETVPRVRIPEVWRVPPELLHEAQDDATVLAIGELERSGVDIVSDGEIRRESYSNHFSNALGGIDAQPGIVRIAVDGGVREIAVPCFSGPVTRRGPVEVSNAQFLVAHTDRITKMTLPGPFTMSRQAVSTHYEDRRDLALALADAVNEEIRDLFATGVDIVQLDEPWMERFPDEARRYGVEALMRALRGVDGTTALHMCFGYAAAVRSKPSRYHFLAELEDTPLHHISIEAAQPQLELASLAGVLPSKRLVVGVLDLADPRIEAPRTVAERIERALEVVAPERLMVGPDCGMKFLPRACALDKLSAMVEGAAIVRRRLNGG